MSDLISRQAVDDVIYDYSRSCDVNYAQIMEYIDKIPSVENKGFDGMTNGEVIQAVFGVMVLTVKDGKVWVERIFFPFDEVWWNELYKTERGGE